MLQEPKTASLAPLWSVVCGFIKWPNFYRPRLYVLVRLVADAAHQPVVTSTQHQGNDAGYDWDDPLPPHHTDARGYDEEQPRPELPPECLSLVDIFQEFQNSTDPSEKQVGTSTCLEKGGNDSQLCFILKLTEVKTRRSTSPRNQVDFFNSHA